MQTKTRLVLSQCRNASARAEEIGVRYRFPRKYYNLLTVPDIEFIYYEPATNGAGVYFGYAEIGKVEADKNDAESFFADILNYHKFSKDVAGVDNDGKPKEFGAFDNQQNAVRQVDPEAFESICEEGEVELESLGIDNEKTDSDDAISNPFDPSKIKVDREQMSVFQVLRKIEHGEIVLQPEFQRNLVWDSVRRSRLIESALLRLPLPAFYFDGVKANEWTVVDGLQRLSTLRDFMSEKTLKLHGLEYLSAAEGKTFEELPRGMQRDLEETPVTLFIIRPDTPPEVKFTIFYRINTGGLVLTAQEIRHALFQGEATKLLRTLSESNEFKRATDCGVSDSRMDARECVLRYFAFDMHPYTDYGKSDLNGYLSGIMKEINSLSPQRIKELDVGFRSAMTTASKILGRLAFRKYSKGSRRRGPVNKALFESWANVLRAYPLERLLEKQQQIVDGLAKAFWSDADYARSLSAGTGSIASVRKRFKRAHQIVKEALQ